MNNSVAMRRLVRLLLILPSFIQTCLCANGQNYNGAIYLPSRPVSKDVSESVSDMASWLKQATGKTFDIKVKGSENAEGIFLQFADDPGQKLPADIIKKISADGQSFYLNIDGTKSATIVGTGDASFINGIYTFLHELGFRWYMPGDAWVVVPKLSNNSLKIAKAYTPDFQNRRYFGTGGINPIADLDPKNEFKNDFLDWNRRNRLSVDYSMKGHTGQVFYNDNKQILDNHPEYFCSHKVNPYGRIDISNADAVDLYVQWALKQVNPEDRFSVIGVEPADGSGGRDDCLPTGMDDVKTWSDKYFWLANKVAQQVEQKKINTLVELYAYSTHAAPPSFEVNKNVYPVIIPYAFQDVTDPKRFIDLWVTKLKGRPFGIYDYWNITQWSKDIPQLNIYTIPDKLKLWKEKNITTINLESTNAKGPMGHAFWIASQMMWDAGLSFDKLYDEFLKQCFGPAAPDIKKMYDRWSLHYQGSMEPLLSMHDLARAAAKTKDEAIQKRIGELKAYVHYLKLYYDYQDNASASNYEELMNYIYGIHSLRLLQTSALITRYIKPPSASGEVQKKPSPPAEVQKKLPASADAQKRSSAATDKQKRNLNAIGYNEIESNFKKDLQENPNAYNLSDFDFDITKAAPAENNKDNKNNNGALYINGRNDYQFYLAEGKNLALQAGATADTRLTISDENDKIWLEKTIKGSKQGYEAISVQLPKGKYTLSFGAYYRFSRIVFPKEIPFFSSSNFYDNAGYPLIYIYVPKGTTEIIYKDGFGPGVNKRGNWKDPGGETVNPVLLKYDVYRVQVPSQYSGKVWVLNIGHRNFEMLNIPDIYSLNNFQYKE